jgi:uncharacterized membrane protein YkvA (DUF1232 family)
VLFNIASTLSCLPLNLNPKEMARVIPTRGMKSARHGLQLFSNRKTLWQMLRSVFNGSYRMSFLTTAIVVAALIYIISPVDIVPDFIVFLGWIDDGVILYLLLKRLNTETQRYIRFKVMERKSRGF